MNNARDYRECRYKWGKIFAHHISKSKNGDLSFFNVVVVVFLPKQCLVENFQGKFQKKLSVTLIFEESP